MTEVSFAVLDVVAEPYAVTPVLTARIGIEADADEPVHAIALRCQVRIEPLRRGYTDEEAAGLLDLFGPRERWSTTQHNFLFLHSSAMVPGFTGVTQVDLPLECTYDFEVTAAEILPRVARRHRSRCNSSSAERFSRRGRTTSPSTKCRGTARITTICRSRCGVN